MDPTRSSPPESHPQFFKQENALAAVTAEPAAALAASASLVQGETDQGQPVVWAQGCHLRLSEKASAQQLLRPLEQDMFR